VASIFCLYIRDLGPIYDLDPRGGFLHMMRRFLFIVRRYCHGKPLVTGTYQGQESSGKTVSALSGGRDFDA
jgi:hypothetical protein